MTFNHIELETAELDEIKLMEIEHMTSQLVRLKESKRLCSCAGKEIIAEYGYSGNFENVVLSMSMMLAIMNDLDMDEIDRETIIQNKKKLITYRDSFENDIHVSAMLEAIKAKDPMRVIDLATQKNMLNDILHDQKLCECFTN